MYPEECLWTIVLLLATELIVGPQSNPGVPPVAIKTWFEDPASYVPVGEIWCTCNLDKFNLLSFGLYVYDPESNNTDAFCAELWNELIENRQWKFVSLLLGVNVKLAALVAFVIVASIALTVLISKWVASPFPDALLPIKRVDGICCSLANVTASSTMFPEITELDVNLPAATDPAPRRAGFVIVPCAVDRLTVPVKTEAVKLPSLGL